LTKIFLLSILVSPFLLTIALSSPISKDFQIFSIGVIKKTKHTTIIEIYKKYEDALLGLHQFSHVIVCYWFHKNDTAEKRNILQVHPRGDRRNPLTGVFATRSPVRPNLIGISICKILSIDGNIIHIDKIDALDGSPVIDLKPYIPRDDSIPDARVPEWVKK